MLHKNKTLVPTTAPLDWNTIDSKRLTRTQLATIYELYKADFDALGYPDLFAISA